MSQVRSVANRSAAYEEVRTTVERQILDEPAPRARGPIGKILRVVERIEATLGGLLLLAILVLVMIQVTVRFTALGGWVWSGELARFSLVWMAFILAGYLLGRDQHIALDLVDYVVPARGRRFVEIFSHVVVAAICAAFVYEGLGLIDAQSGISSSSAEIPMSLVYAVPTVGFALTGVRALVGPFVRKGSA